GDRCRRRFAREFNELPRQSVGLFVFDIERHRNNVDGVVRLSLAGATLGTSFLRNGPRTQSGFQWVEYLIESSNTALTGMLRQESGLGSSAYRPHRFGG